MLLPLVLVFITVPIAELFVIVQAGRTFGIVPTLLTLVAISLTGAWLVKREGLNVLARASSRFREGFLPGREMVDGVIILFAGALLMSPGFLTDLVGLALLVPPTRAVVRAWVTAYATRALRRRGQGFV